LAGQTIDGGTTSRTVTLKVHIRALPLGSRAHAVTLVVPTGKS
jgi:hypothetical protein